MGFARQFVTSIDANRSVKDELADAVGKQRGRRRISVTDLVSPRQAFYRRTRPEIQPSPERRQSMLSGIGFHDLFGKAVSAEEFVEQFVEFQGIAGKIDIYEDVPTELKTTGFLPDDIRASRPGYIDQLGMYCAMTRKANGRLIIYRRAGRIQPAALRAFEVVFNDLNPIVSEMLRRRDSLQTALDSGNPSSLPRCEWFESGCDYEVICGCGEAPPFSRVVAPDSVTVVESRELVATVAARLEQEREPSHHFRLNDLVFPRKAAFERSGALEDEDSREAEIEVRLTELDKQGFYGALNEACRFGVPGAFSRIPVELRSLKGWVGTYRGLPTIIRTTKLADMIDRTRVPDLFGHYVDRLAIECSLTGHELGRIVVYYQSLPHDKFMVYDLCFRGLAEVAAEADRRLGLLEGGAPPQELPPCPAWMARRCDFAPACGCGKAAVS